MAAFSGRIWGRISSYRHINEHIITSLLAIIIGILGGYGAVLFRHLIRGVQFLFYQNGSDFLQFAAEVPFYIKIAMPALAGAIVGPLVHFWAREAKGHGVPEVMEAVALKGGVIRRRVAFAEILASAISIGGGGSVGREGPIAMIGSSVGSSVGQILRVSRDRQRTFVGCGAAAGIAATFNAPLGGVLFALEILLGDFGVSTFSPIVLSSVTATIISRYHFGNFPAFAVPHYEVVSYYEYPLYFALGIVAALVAILFVTILYKSEDLFDEVPIPEYLKPILGGAIVGCMLIVFPQVFGVGYGAIDLSLTNKLAATILFTLIFVKIAATSITIGSGMSGGVFAPSLMIGAMAGGWFGQVVHSLFPDLTATGGAYALVAMGAVVAATTHAPITAILILFELTSQYQIILPLMISCITAALLAGALKKGNIYNIKLLRRGVELHMGRERSILRQLRVQDVILTHPHAVPESMYLVDIIETFKRTNASYLQVIDDQDELAGIISFRDVRAVLQEEELGHLIIARDVATRNVITVTPNDTLEDVLKKMGIKGISQLPVVKVEDPKKVIGVLEENAIIATYNREVMARELSRPAGG
ncbi:MAG: chloride channel protein [Deltaproteobacteria bacterium]|nr:chloride channel protein [Deltaproteobacteria bacterium]